MSRRPETADRILEDAIREDLRQKDPGRFEYLEREDRLNTYVDGEKKSILRRLLHGLLWVGP